MIQLLHMDCMEYMATLPDGAFDLAIVDPPYGRGALLEKRRKLMEAWAAYCETAARA